jgi:hypothetical protein
MTVQHGLRRQIREPAKEICAAARQLLQLEPADEQRRLAQQLLENALLVQLHLDGHPPTATRPPAMPALAH